MKKQRSLYIPCVHPHWHRQRYHFWGEWCRLCGALRLNGDRRFTRPIAHRHLVKGRMW